MNTKKTEKEAELYRVLRKRYAEAIESENKKIIEQELEDAASILIVRDEGNEQKEK
jgi:hypothetical protein